MSGHVIHLGSRAIETWPASQVLERSGHESVFSTQFTDIAEYHPRLIARILEMEGHKGTRRQYFQGACGTKVHRVESWGCSEADLLQARAKELFRRALDSVDAVVDLSWANVYRAGDYCIPHSHLRSTASVVYCLDVGDEDSTDPINGRFYFADPRLSICCKSQAGYMTNAFFPKMQPGTMLIFPSQLVHAVNPYAGERPRITLSWNINPHAIPGTPAAVNT